MKKRLFALLLALCLLLSGCEKTPAADSVPPDPTATPTPSEPASPEPAPSGPVSPEPSATPAPSAYVTPDYSAHAEIYEDEENYRTVQADLGKLSKGEKALALEMGPADWSGKQYAPEKDEIWGYDVRSCDVSGEDLRVIENWNDISFNSDTVWPAADKLPEGFDPEAVLELGKDPGLGIRKLHEQGITGEGVGVAILDQPLYTGHEQYRDNLMLYEALHSAVDMGAEMHGSAVSSIAVGKDVGVAPGAKLYFIACKFGHNTGDGGYEEDLGVMADGIYRVLEINRNLPEGEKIRVISISKGADTFAAGFGKLQTAVQAALKQGVLVLTTNPEHFYDFSFTGMNRDGLADPNDPAAYRPATWYLDMKPHQVKLPEDHILVPMSRTYAACVGEADYEWGYEGGMSWAVPWLAGFYALCCQADPECTPERFFEAVKGAATFELVYGPAKTFFGKVIDPAAAIEALQKG